MLPPCGYTYYWSGIPLSSVRIRIVDNVQASMLSPRQEGHEIPVNDLPCHRSPLFTSTRLKYLNNRLRLLESYSYTAVPLYEPLPFTTGLLRTPVEL